MKMFSLTVAIILGIGSAAAAQEPLRLDRAPALELEDDVAPAEAPEVPALTPFELPRSLDEPTADKPKAEDEYSPFSIGAVAGYLKAKNADRGTWTGGAQARFRFGLLAAEASITFHESEYEHGDVHVTQYPVQLTAFLYILPVGPIRPYILGGVGWYYTRYDYSGQFASTANRTENIFGEHLGAGAELFLGKSISLNADVRYIFLNATTDKVLGGQFNYWQATAGLNFFF